MSYIVLPLDNLFYCNMLRIVLFYYCKLCPEVCLNFNLIVVLLSFLNHLMVVCPQSLYNFHTTALGVSFLKDMAHYKCSLLFLLCIYCRKLPTKKILWDIFSIWISLTAPPVSKAYKQTRKYAQNTQKKIIKG